MKKLLITLTAITALIINAAYAGSGSVSLGYGSDTFNKGSLLTEENLSASVEYSTELNGLGVQASASSADELSDGNSVYVFSGGVSNQIADLVNVYLGLEHEEMVSGGSQLDAVLKASVSSVLSPYFLIQRDTSDNNYVVEAGISHSFDLNFANLALAGSIGNADRYGIENNDYYTLGASLSKDLTDTVQASISYDRVDSESIDGEDLLSAGLSFSF